MLIPLDEAMENAEELGIFPADLTRFAESEIACGPGASLHQGLFVLLEKLFTLDPDVSLSICVDFKHTQSVYVVGSGSCFLAWQRLWFSHQYTFSMG